MSSFHWYCNFKDILFGLSMNWCHMWSHSFMLPLIREVYKYWQAVRLMVMDPGFQKFEFLHRRLILSLATNTASSLSWSDRLISFIFKEISAMHPSLNFACHSFFYGKIMLHGKNDSFSSKLKQSSKCFVILHKSYFCLLPFYYIEY